MLHERLGESPEVTCPTPLGSQKRFLESTKDCQRNIKSRITGSLREILIKHLICRRFYDAPRPRGEFFPLRFGKERGTFQLLLKIRL